MCRNIKPLFNFDPPASDEEIAAAALQFVRKVSGFGKPSTANQEAIDSAVVEISVTISQLLSSLTTNIKPKNREDESRKAKIRSVERFGSTPARDTNNASIVTE
jgi:hypothetical protein